MLEVAQFSTTAQHSTAVRLPVITRHPANIHDLMIGKQVGPK